MGPVMEQARTDGLILIFKSRQKGTIHHHSQADVISEHYSAQYNATP